MTGKVTLADCRASGVFCRDGGELFFQLHGLDFKDFLRNGIDAVLLENINDGVANIILEYARERWKKADDSQGI